MNKFRVIKKLLLLYFKLKSPKQIVVVVSYGLGYVINAAKECGIKTIELQHGVISPYHMGYAYPNEMDDVCYFPDELWTWGSFWNKSSSFPISQKNILACGNEFFISQKRQYISIPKCKNTILFISQGAIGKRIVRFVDELLLLLDGSFQITLKLHPGEYDSFGRYEHVNTLLDCPRVTIVKECDLYSLFAVSEYQVGVYSTAIYEGMGFGCKTILLNMPGVEYMEHLLEMEMVKLCDKPESFRGTLASFTDKDSMIIQSYAKKFFQ